MHCALHITCICDGDWVLQLFPMNKEFLVSVGHKLALIKSLLFVHTAHHYYLLGGLVRCCVLCIIRCTILLFRVVIVNDFLCGNQVLMRSGNLNTECCTGTDKKSFLFWIAFKPKTHPANASVLMSLGFKWSSEDSTGTQPISKQKAEK